MLLNDKSLMIKYDTQQNMQTVFLVDYAVCLTCSYHLIVVVSLY